MQSDVKTSVTAFRTVRRIEVSPDGDVVTIHGRDRANLRVVERVAPSDLESYIERSTSLCHPTFMAGYLSGVLEDEDIDEWVNIWHIASDYRDTPLYEYLGMTHREFGDWCRKRRTLKQIRDDRLRPWLPSQIFNYVLFWVVGKLVGVDLV